jgi:hypothetical protein
MKFINKILIIIIFNLLPLFFLISCSGSGNCLPSGVTPSTLNITLTSASSYPSGVAEKIPLIVTNVGITAINKLNYTVTLNTTGVNITLDASNCSSLTVNASCTLWASLPAGSNPGTFAVAAGWSTVDSNATAGKIVNKLKLLLNNTLTAKVYIGLVDTPTNSEPNSAGITLYYPPMVVANPNQATTVIISALVSSQYAGTFNTIQLLDSSGNLLAATVLTGNSGSQLTNLTMGDVVTFAVVIPTGSTQYQFKLQTLENGVVQSTGTNLNVINLVNQTQIVGILNVSPNYFNLTQYYESQIITLNNSGTGDITDLKITPVSPLSKISTSCGKTLAVHDSCEYIVTFDKSQPLAGTTSVGIDYNSTSSTTVHASATVNYTGSNAVAGLSIRSGSNPNFDFSSTTTNNTASTVVTVTNIGNNIESNISVSNLPAVFSLSTQGVTNACSSASGFSLAAGQSCALNLTYVNSVITNSTNQQVTFTYNYLTLSGSASTSSNIMLTWQTTPPRAIISFSPSSFNYGTILNDGAESVSTTFTITNNGDASATGANLTFQPNNSLFNISGGTCQAPPAAGASCTLVVQFGSTNAVPQNVSTQMILDYVPYSGAPLVSTSVALNGIIAAVNAGVMTESAGAISGFAGGDGTAATAYQVEQNATHPTVVYNILS